MMTWDMGHMTCDTGHEVGGEQSLKKGPGPISHAILSDRCDACSTSAPWLYQQQDLEEKGYSSYEVSYYKRVKVKETT